MNYHRDDGSSVGGMKTIVFVLIAFIAGYWIRDQGVRFKIDVPAIEQRRAK